MALAALCSAGTDAEDSGVFTVPGAASVAGRLLVASAASIPDEAPVLDTTGAGDAFNAAVLYGIATGEPPSRAYSPHRRRRPCG